jgi:rod shape-determining protein MreB
MDEAIVRHVKTSHRLLVGGEEAEAVKIRIGSAWPLADDETAELRGRDLVTGLLRRTVIAADEVRHALTLPLERIVEVVRTTLERAPAGLSADVQRGLVLVGVGALLRGIERRLQAETGLAVTIAEEPLTRIAVGAGRSLEEPRLHLDFAKGRARRRRAGTTR